MYILLNEYYNIKLYDILSIDCTKKILEWILEVRELVKLDGENNYTQSPYYPHYRAYKFLSRVLKYINRGWYITNFDDYIKE